MKPDPAFLAWFASEWKDRHAAVQVPGLPHASWDRKAAWLLYVAEGHALPAAPTKTDKEDLFD